MSIHPYPPEQQKRTRFAATNKEVEPSAVSAAVSPAAWASALDKQARREGKLAPQLAKCIETEVFRLGWPVDHPLGTEEALAARFGVSRTVLREALAITERDGVTRRQRGRTGGMYVAAPAQQAVVMALGNYLNAAGLNEQQYGDAYVLLNGLALRLAAERCTPEEATAARAFAAQPLADDDLDSIWRRTNQINNLMLAMAKNPAIETFCAASVYSGMERMYGALVDTDADASLQFARRVLKLIKRQLEAVIAGDNTSAVLADRTSVRNWKGHYHPTAARSLSVEQATRVAAGMAAIYRPDKAIKRADVLALQIHRDISIGGYRDGDRLDSEATLLQRYRVSRGVLREAIRALEQHAVVRPAEGRGGGLCVTTPDPTAAVRSAVLYFRFIDLNTQELLDLGVDMQLALASAAAKRVTVQGVEILKPLSAALQPTVLPHTAGEAQRQLEAIYTGLAMASDNPVFVLLMQVHIAYLTVAARRREEPDWDPEGFRRYLMQMREVESALRHGDANLARRSLLLVKKIGLGIQPHTRDLRQLMDHVY